MQITVTGIGAAWLRLAAHLSQIGRPLEDAKAARALCKRLLDESNGVLTDMENGGSKVEDEDATITYEVKTDDLTRLDFGLKQSNRWPFNAWSDEIFDSFVSLVAQVSEWLEESHRVDKWQALPESEKRKALAAAKKEK